MKTTLYTVLCIAIRLGAVLMAVGLLEMLPGFFWGTSDKHFVVFGLGFAIFGLLVAVALWLWPGLLARWAVGRSGNEVFESTIDADQMQRIAFAVLGVWLCIQGLLGCFSHGLLMLFLRSRIEDQVTASLPVSEWRLLIQYGAMALLGAALTLGSHGLVGLLRRMRDYSPARGIEPVRDANIAPED